MKSAFKIVSSVDMDSIKVDCTGVEFTVKKLN